MLDWIYALTDFYNAIFNQIFFNMYVASNASFGSILVVGAIVGFAISVFWKGAHK